MHYPAKNVACEVLRHNGTPKTGNWRNNSTRATVKRQARSERVDAHSTLFAALSTSGAPVPRLFALSPPSGQGAARGMRCSGNKRYNKEGTCVYLVPLTISLHHGTRAWKRCCVMLVCQSLKCRNAAVISKRHMLWRSTTPVNFFSLWGVSDRGVPFSCLIPRDLYQKVYPDNGCLTSIECPVVIPRSTPLQMLV